MREIIAKNKMKATEILITALISATIAFLQAWITGLNNTQGFEQVPETAGAISIGFQTLKRYFS